MYVLTYYDFIILNLFSSRLQRHRWFAMFSICSFKMKLMAKLTLKYDARDAVAFVKHVSSPTVGSARHVGI